LLIWVLCSWLHSESTYDTPTLELILEELQDENTQDIYDRQALYSTALYGAFSFADNPYSRAQLKLKSNYFQAYGGFKHADLKLQTNLQLRYKDHFALGNYRIGWGRGLLLHRAPLHPSILNPSHPNTYEPQGLAVTVKPGALQILAFASYVERSTKLSEGLITQLPKSKSELLGSTQERLLGAGLSYATDGFDIGSLYYRQSYDRAFSDAARDSLLEAISFYAIVTSGVHRLMAECTVQDQPSLALSWDMTLPRFMQEWKYQRLAAYQRPAYAAKANLLSSSANREELSAKVRFLPLKHLQIQAQSTINKGFGDLSEANWLARHQISLGYSDHLSKASLSLTVIDREILSALDDSFSSSIPLHYRINAALRQSIHENLCMNLAVRFHHQDRLLALSRGSWWKHSMDYHSGGLGLGLGYSVWNSGNYTMLISDDSDAGYQSLGKNSAQAMFMAEYSWKQMRAKLSFEQELKQDRSTSLTANISLSLK
jgi:hypothetical protein